MIFQEKYELWNFFIHPSYDRSLLTALAPSQRASKLTISFSSRAVGCRATLERTNSYCRRFLQSIEVWTVKCSTFRLSPRRVPSQMRVNFYNLSTRSVFYVTRDENREQLELNWSSASCLRHNCNWQKICSSNSRNFADERGILFYHWESGLVESR